MNFHLVKGFCSGALSGFLVAEYGHQAANALINVSARMAERLPGIFSKYAPVIADFGAKGGALAPMSVAYGLVAGAGIGFLANRIEITLCRKNKFFRKNPLARKVVSHLTAGTAVFGLSLLAVKVGLVAAPLTIGGALALTGTTFALNQVMDQVQKLHVRLFPTA